MRRARPPDASDDADDTTTPTLTPMVATPTPTPTLARPGARRPLGGGKEDEDEDAGVRERQHTDQTPARPLA